MKNILQIFKTDVKNIAQRRAAIVVVVALMILPSMYAWFNILPSWDPYANTEDVAIAVVNLDEGAELEGEPMNVGDEVVDSLKENKKLGWRFVSEEEASKGVRAGDYYASIIIPKNFSEKLTSVLDDEPEQPVLDYYINEKINAIAPKVTSAGASGMVESIQSGFIKVANEAIFSAFNDAGIELEANQESIIRLRDAIYQVEKDLPEIERLLGVAGKDLDKVEDANKKAHKGLKRAEEVSLEVQELSKKIHKLLNETDGYVNKYVPIIQEDLGKAKEVISKIPTITQKVSEKEELFDEIIVKVEQNTEKIDDGVNALGKLEEVLIKADKEASDGKQINTLIDQLNDDYNRLEKTKKDVEQAIDALEKTGNIPDELPSIPSIKPDGNESEKSNDQVEEDATARAKAAGVMKAANAKDQERTIKELKALLQLIETRQEAILKLIDASESVQKSIENGLFLDGAEKVHSYEDDLKQFKKDVNAAIKRAKEGKATVDETIVYIEEQAASLESTIGEMMTFIDQDLLPTYRQEMQTAQNALNEADKKLAKVVSYFPKAEELLDKVDDGVEIGQEELAKINKAFPEAKEKVIDLAEKVRHLDEKGDLAELIRFLRNDPSAEGEFFAEPISLKEHELFPIPNYGSAMAPFFTTLAIWVGGLILVSSLIVDVPNKSRYKSYEAYFGRLLTFWSIGMMQALIVTLGNMFLLKTFVAHKVLFVLFGFIISTTFIIMIYTFVSVFGNTGKVIAIILLVMQLGASGGTFPIQMTPKFFQNIHGFLPFTHALQLFREAVGGVIWPSVFKHIAWLVGYMVLFMFIGIKLKETINKRSDKFLEEARDSDVIL